MNRDNRLKRESYFIRTEGPDPNGVKEALGWLFRSSKPSGFLAVHGYGNLDGVVREVIGEGAVKSLIKFGRIKVSNVEIQLVTEHKMTYDGQNSPMVALYPSSKLLDVLDSIRNISAMLVVPWNFSEVEPWIRAWNATELGAQRTERAEPLLRSTIVEQALSSLTHIVNLATGISHPRDREAAIQMFEILRNAGEQFSPEDIKAWLVGEGGWNATDAEDVAVVARKVLEGRSLRSGQRVWAENILEIWQKQAQTKEG